ncbi:hypothetical protein SUGI_0829660, partial [Cryptomeria japonica]
FLKVPKMPRYDDRFGNTRLYVGRLSSRTRTRDLEDLFGKYGRVRDVDLKHDFAFIEFSDARDADEARYYLNGRDLNGSRIVVEFARGGPRGGGGGSREYLGRGPPPGSGRCFNCGNDGHWARDCKAGDWKNKCYRCGERGHIERNCPNSPKSYSRRERSPSRSRSRSLSRGRGRSRSPSYKNRSYSRSPSSPRRDARSTVQDERRSRSRSYSRSPRRGRRHSPAMDDRRSISPVSDSPNRQSDDRNNVMRNSRRSESPASDDGHGPRDSASPERDSPGRYQSPAANGKSSHSPSATANNQTPSPARDSPALRDSPGAST